MNGAGYDLRTQLERAVRERDEARAALAWALDYINETAEGVPDINGTPAHDCEFFSNPEKGACRFHDLYWTAREVLASLGDGREETAGHCPCSCCQEARNRAEHNRSVTNVCSCADYPEAERCDCLFCLLAQSRLGREGEERNDAHD